MKKVKAIIFDMNGTIFDTAKLVIEILKQSFENLGVNLTSEQLDEFIGKNFSEMKQLALKYASKEQVEEGVKTCMGIFKKYIEQNGTPIKIGFREVVVQAKNGNVKIALATCAPKDLTNFLFHYAKIDKSIFDVIITGDDIKNLKPDSEIYLKACEKLNLEPKDCMAIEDSYVGLKSAKDVGLITARVQDCQKEDPSKNALVDYKFDKLLDFWYAFKMSIVDLEK